MNQKKSRKIILIMIILLVILILLAGVAYAYFATDVFKSNKDLFFKYITQIGDEKEGLIETQLKEYFEKQKSTPYLNEGGISVNIISANNQQQYENTNKMNLAFDGQVDIANSQVTQNLTLNYSNNVKFPLSYKKIENTIGIQSTYIGRKYITTNIDSTDSLLEKNVKDIDKLQKLTNIQFGEQDLQKIKNTYFNIVSQQLQDKNFSKIEETNHKGYKLTLNGEELKNIITKLLETLKNDQDTLDKINEYIKMQKNSSKITLSNIDNFITDVNNDTELNNENIEITVYQSKEKINGLLMKTNEAEVKLEKILTGNDLQYNIELKMNNHNQLRSIGLIAKFAGLQSMHNVTENYELTLETDEMKYQYNYNNNVEFTESTNIEAFNDNNSLMLDKISEEERNNFINAIIERIQSVNESQMQELGLEANENPIQYLLPQFQIYSSSINAITQSNMSELEVKTFNEKFEVYESTNLKGVTVKGLLSTIELNNESQEDEDRKMKEIHFDGQEYEVTDQNITLIKSSIETGEAYRVEFERDEHTGTIYRTVINKK